MLNPHFEIEPLLAMEQARIRRRRTASDASARASFPGEPTSDQFFDEAKFEAYRELGYQIGQRTFENMPLAQLFS